MTGLLYKLGHLCARWRFVVLLIWLVLIVGVVVAAEGIGSETTDNVSAPGHREPGRKRPPQRALPEPGVRLEPPRRRDRHGEAHRLQVLERDRVVGQQPEEDGSRQRRGEPAEPRGRLATQQGQEDRLHLGDARRRAGQPHRRRGERGPGRCGSRQEGGPTDRRGRLRRPGAVEGGLRQQRQDRHSGRGRSSCCSSSARRSRWGCRSSPPCSACSAA